MSATTSVETYTLALPQTGKLLLKDEVVAETAVAQIRTYTRNGIAIASPSGRFDAFAAQPLRSWLDNVIAAQSAKVIVNLSKVNFIDSSAIAILMRGLKYCQQNDGDLYLCGLQQPVRIIAELMRLNTVFSIFADEEEAIAAFTK
ncbi:MAG: STAS domain-containing protein [Anaerolineales bacterium]|nr:STAS domain-containing protein [Anaerolineales bacterium]